MRSIIFAIFFLIAGFSFSQAKDYGIPKTGKDIYSFIPNGYDTLMIAEGDLNKDKVPDVVMVLRHNDEKEDDLEKIDTDSIPSRILLVLFRKGNVYKLSDVSAAAILCKHCGGIMGDPFLSVSIENGLLLVDHYGGSAWRWSYKHKFRFQNNAFFLIGQTYLYYWNVEMCEKLDAFAGTEYEDINFVTGSYEKKKVSQEGCKLLENKKGKKPVKLLVKLSKFSFRN